MLAINLGFFLSGRGMVDVTSPSGLGERPLFNGAQGELDMSGDEWRSGEE
jgi:hypothetical protein